MRAPRGTGVRIFSVPNVRSEFRTLVRNSEPTPTGRYGHLSEPNVRSVARSVARPNVRSVARSRPARGQLAASSRVRTL